MGGSNSSQEAGKCPEWDGRDAGDVDNDDVGDGRDADDIYIMMKCLCVTKNEHFLKRSVCQSWFVIGFHGFSR